MFVMTFLLVLAIAVIIGLIFLLGFRLGEGHSDRSTWAQAQAVRARAAAAQRELHELTRSAFVAMAEQAEQTQHRCGS